jgi:L-ascorbate metabolism protein UlaG (beta-lactamase superfamily)
MSPATLFQVANPLALVGWLAQDSSPLARRVARWVAGLFVPLVPLVLSGCSTVNPYYDPSRPHHRPDGFNNLHVDNWRADAPSFWRWMRERRLADLPADEPQRVERTVTDVTLLKANRHDVTVTWIGQSTVLWQVNGLNILTDPHFGPRASPLAFAGPRRLVPLPVTLDSLPRIDVVLISHNHYDHLDRGTVQALDRQPGGPPLFLVPLGVDLWMRGEGIRNVQRMDWWDRHPVPAPGGDLLVHLVPVQHWSRRSVWDRNATLWGGFVVEATVDGQALRLLFAGDTGYSPDFKVLGKRFTTFDFAAIPVGCYQPRWFMTDQHVNEDEAVRIHLDVNSRLSMGIHWGTFRLCDDPIQAPLDGLPRARTHHGVPADDFVLFRLGETRVLKRVHP